MTLRASGTPSSAGGDRFSQRLTVTVFAKKVNGPAALRKAFRMSLSELADALGQITGRAYDKSTLLKFEQAHAGKTDWARHGASRFLREAYELLIRTYVETRSRGKYTARVAGTRTWRIHLVEVMR